MRHLRKKEPDRQAINFFELPFCDCALFKWKAIFGGGFGAGIAKLAIFARQKRHYQVYILIRNRRPVLFIFKIQFFFFNKANILLLPSVGIRCIVSSNNMHVANTRHCATRALVGNNRHPEKDLQRTPEAEGSFRGSCKLAWAPVPYIHFVTRSE